jgi:hypothetical protein
MAQRVVKQLMVFVLTFVFVATSVAQTNTQPTTTDEATTKSKGIGGPRKQLATILFAGLGGSILGLSTLSFYGRPQDHLANIAIGFAVGVIVGTAYVTYKAANDPRELYGNHYIPELEKMSQAQQLRLTNPAPLTASYALSF